MTRALRVTALLAMGLFLAGTHVAAQPSAPSAGGQVIFGALGVEDIGSSKFQEYRDVPKGASVPYASLFVVKDGVDFKLDAFNVGRTDQRYTGWLKGSWLGVSFDYNETPHNMGFKGTSIFTESAPGVWTISAIERAVLQQTTAATPAAGRTLAFYTNLMAPTFASAGTVDVTSVRKRGMFEVSTSKDLPVALTVSYLRELKSGYRGLSGGNIRGMVNPSYEVPGPLDELNQDFGVRAAYAFGIGSAYASFNRNLYNNRAETLFIDNPFQAVDALVAGGLGGPAADRIVNAPDNEASTSAGGIHLRFARQTRVNASVSHAIWTQDAAFYPYTANTAVFTPAGVQAASLAALPRTSYDGKINQTMLNFSFSSRPARGLGLRMQFRSNEQTDKSGKFVITGDMSAPHSNWNTVTPSAANPFGRPTANPYNTKTSRFTASASYDIVDALTVEGTVLSTDMKRSYREATSGTDKGYSLAAIFRASDWMKLRARFDDISRDAKGETFFGFQADEAERDTKRAMLDLDLSPMSGLDLTFSYGRRDVDYINRPNRRSTAAGAQEIPNTPSGLLEAKYDTYSVDVAITPNNRASLGAYYTYEKDRTTNQFSTLTGVNLNNLLNYAGSNKTDTFGGHAAFVLVPDVWTFTLNAMHQKVDGLMDITAREAGSFYTPGRTTLIPPGQGGAADITDWDDTKITTLTAELAYNMAESWTMTMGYFYEKYDFRDAFNAGDSLMPQAVYTFLKPNIGAYTANVVYARLAYRF